MFYSNFENTKKKNLELRNKKLVELQEARRQIKASLNASQNTIKKQLSLTALLNASINASLNASLNAQKTIQNQVEQINKIDNETKKLKKSYEYDQLYKNRMIYQSTINKDLKKN